MKSGHIKNWGGWEKISRQDVKENLKEQKSDFPRKKVKKFDLQSLQNINKQKIKEEWEKEYAQKISKLATVKRPEICSLCGAGIADDFFRIYQEGEKKICRKCRQTLPHCQQCGRIVKNPVRDLKEHYCDDCKRRRVCTVCGRLFDYDLKKFKGLKGRYCGDCLDTSVKCLFCGLPVGCRAYGQELKTYSCKFCRPGGFTNLSSYESLYNRVIDFFFVLDSTAFPDPLTLNMCEPLKMPKPPAVKKFFLLDGDLLYFLKGTPQKRFVDLTIHIHALRLIREISPATANPDVRKGFVAFIKFLYYKYERFYKEAADIKDVQFSQNTFFKPLYRYYKQNEGTSFNFREMCRGLDDFLKR